MLKKMSRSQDVSEKKDCINSARGSLIDKETLNSSGGMRQKVTNSRAIQANLRHQGA